MKKSKNISLSGILTALCVVALFIGSVFQTLDLSSAAIGSIIMLIAYMELGGKWAWSMYFAISLLSLLLLPNKTPSFLFMIFAGYYPILKVYLNRIKPMWLSYLSRLAIFDLCLFAVYFLAVTIGIGLQLFPDTLLAITVILANITFVVYDFALERISVTYATNIRPKIFGRR